MIYPPAICQMPMCRFIRSMGRCHRGQILQSSGGPYTSLSTADGRDYATGGTFNDPSVQVFPLDEGNGADDGSDARQRAFIYAG